MFLFKDLQQNLWVKNNGRMFSGLRFGFFEG
jgi:hypothetical protein